MTIQPESNGSAPIRVVFSQPEPKVFKAAVTIRFDIFNSDLEVLREEVRESLMSLFGEPGPVELIISEGTLSDDH